MDASALPPFCNRIGLLFRRETGPNIQKSGAHAVVRRMTGGFLPIAGTFFMTVIDK